MCPLVLLVKLGAKVKAGARARASCAGREPLSLPAVERMEGMGLGRPARTELRLRTALLELDQRPRLPAAIECGHLARRDRPLLRSISVMNLCSTAPSHATPHCPRPGRHHRHHGTGDGAGTGHRRLLRRDFGKRIGERGLRAFRAIALRAFRAIAVTQTRLQTRPRSPLRCRGLWRGIWRGLWSRFWRGLRLVEERALDRVGEWAVFLVVRHPGVLSHSRRGRFLLTRHAHGVTKREVWHRKGVHAPAYIKKPFREASTPALRRRCRRRSRPLAAGSA